MAENRVLNYSEFAGKYSKESQQDMAASYSEFSKAADNFQEGFDDDTYEDGQTGPKRPLNIGTEETPIQPGETGSPAFSTEHEGMESPEENDLVTQNDLDNNEVDGEEFEGPQPDLSASAAGYDNEGGNPEEGEDESEEEENEENEEEENEESEEEENEEEEEEEESNESYKHMIVLESFDDFTMNSQPKSRYAEMLDIPELEGEEDEFEASFDDEEEERCVVRCKSCGAEKEIPTGEYPMGKDKIDDPNSWWQGSVLGMQCGCNM